MLKQEARKIARARVAKMSQAEREWASDAIVDAVSSLDLFKKAKKVFVYLGTDTEPDTHEIVGLALAMEKTVAVPRVKGDYMNAVTITPFSDFKTNQWGILEPVKGYALDEIDLAIIPLVAFDGLKRVGHGKGYYDKFLAEHKCTKLGLAFDCQCVSGLEVDSFDVPLDCLVTEKRITTSSKKCFENKFGGQL
jgi:5-formyltetrahydrofolate cyclo-ligase